MTNETKTEAPNATDNWTTQFADLKQRFPKVREPILVAIHILTQEPYISVDDAKARAAMHGVRITAASVNGARKLLAKAAAATPTSPNAAHQTTPANWFAARRVRAAETGLDPEAEFDWIPGDEDGVDESVLIRRREQSRRFLERLDLMNMAHYAELWDLVRHKVRDAEGKTWPNDAIRDRARTAADEIERLYGESRVLDDFDFGLLHERISDLAWVLDSESDESLDT
ncbi:MAG: hypothetical protein ABL997_16875 [Planctomycetota bacterium]